MFNLLYSVLLALIAGCTTQPEATATAPPATTRTATTVTTTSPGRVVSVQQAPRGGDPVIVATVDSIDGLDEGATIAVRMALQEDDATHGVSGWSATGTGNKQVWLMRPAGVEFDENAAFLGVATEPMAPQTAAQLPITPGTGLVLTTIELDSPAAAAGLEQFDVLAMLGDQKLVNAEQLAVLIRAQKPGDEVELTYVRGGKIQTASVKLAGKRLAKLGPGGARASGGFFDTAGNVIMIDPSAMDLQRFYGTGQGGQRFRATAAPAPAAAAEGTTDNNVKVNYTTDRVAITYQEENGAVTMSVKELPGGAVLFEQSRVPTRDELAAFTPEVRADVERMIKDTQRAKLRQRTGSGAQLQSLRPLPAGARGGMHAVPAAPAAPAAYPFRAVPAVPPMPSAPARATPQPLVHALTP